MKDYSADISNPSERMVSIICPTYPAFTIEGFITQHVQLLNYAVVLSGDYFPKKKFNSLNALVAF